MSDTPISSMNYKELRNEVQLLRDELALMKRKYEDILYNLDFENFSSSFLKEQDGMKTQISVTAEGIQTVVSNMADIGQRVSTLTQTADGFRTEVEDIKTNVSKNASSIQQTAEAIETKVSSEDLQNALAMYSTTTQTADLISSTVTKEMSGYATEDYVINETSELNTILTSKISQNASNIALVVTKTNGAYAVNAASIIAAINGSGESTVTIDADKINLDGITRVANDLYIGKDQDHLTDTSNMIRFKDGATISNAEGALGYDGLCLSASRFTIGDGPNTDNIYIKTVNLDLSGCTKITWGDNPTVTATAVFG